MDNKELLSELDKAGIASFRFEAVEGRITRVENEIPSIRNEIGSIKDRLNTLHIDLTKGNGLMENVRDAVVRNEQNTKEALQRIEVHTKDSLNELKSSVKGAVELATTAKTVGKWPIVPVVTGITAGVFAALVIVFSYLKS